MNNSQILAEFQSVCAKSPGLGEGRAWTSFTLLVSGVFSLDLLVKKGVGVKIQNESMCSSTLVMGGLLRNLLR
jgi:hypothetical protein